MPIIDDFDTKFDIDRNDIKAIIEKHGAKLRNLRLVLLDFLFDAELNSDLMRLGSFGLVAPAITMQEAMIGKYGDPPNEALFTDEDLINMRTATALSSAWGGKRFIYWDAYQRMDSIRRAAAEMQPAVDALLKSFDTFGKALDFEDAIAPGNKPNV